MSEPPSEPSYRFIDHTGDFALEVEADDAEGAIRGMARGLLHLLTDDPDRVEDRETRPFTLEALDAPGLLVALGNELLYLFEAEGFLWAHLVITSQRSHLADGFLVGELHGEPFDPDRHPIARPFKAVTHHGALLEMVDGRARARVIVDL